MISCILIESVYRIDDEMDVIDVVFFWELEYVRYIFYYVGLKRFGFDMDCNFIDFDVFDLLENLVNILGRN